jgi:hypothetical protein
VGTVRAAVILFVDMDEKDCQSPQDLAEFTRQGLHQAGFGMHKENGVIPVNFRGNILQVRLVDVMEAGMAIGNGYLWNEVTTKAYAQRGIYTTKQQAQIDAEEKWEKENDQNQQEVYETSSEKDA